jgi:hypothetical protein
VNAHKSFATNILHVSNPSRFEKLKLARVVQFSCSCYPVFEVC